MQQTDVDYLRRAFGLAAAARQRGEYPFGALLVANGEIGYEAYDQCRAQSDPTAHAELRLIREYCRQQQRRTLEGCTLYSSAEPCIMCAGAIKWARISRVVFGVSQTMLQTVSGGRSKPGCASLINSGGRTIEIVGPLLAEEGLAVFAGFRFGPQVPPAAPM